MEFRPAEQQSLFRRRLRNVTPKALECDLLIAPPSQSNECELDPDAFKSNLSMKEWVWETGMKISHRPSLAFSPSFLLSPICLSPVLRIDDELVSPFSCINQILATPRNSNTSDTSSKSFDESTSCSIFTFDADDVCNAVPLSSPSKCSSRCLCVIPEERELTVIDLQMAANSKESQINQYRKADTSFAPPKSPSIAVATQNKRNSVKKKAQKHHKKTDNSKNTRQTWNSPGEKQQTGKPKQHCKREPIKNTRTLAKGFDAKRASGNTMFMSMVTR